MAQQTELEQNALDRTAQEQRNFEQDRVAVHYEHDPAIFSMVLGSTLAYSTGVYESTDDDLEIAQARKLAHIRDLLNLAPGEKAFDAGCGWGSVMLSLAQETDARIRGITLSPHQKDFLLDKADRLGVRDRVDVSVEHVEEVELEPESLDAIYFVGSIVHMHNREAVHKWAANALKPNGRLFISDCYFPTMERGDRLSTANDYILGRTLGYCRLTSLSEELGMMEAAGLDVVRVEDHTASYVRTVGHWIDNIRQNRSQINELAPGFARTLQAYMTIGRTSFARRTALEYMILAQKPGSPVPAVS